MQVRNSCSSENLCRPLVGYISSQLSFVRTPFGQPDRVLTSCLDCIWAIQYSLASFAALLNAIPATKRHVKPRLRAFIEMFAPEITTVSRLIPSRAASLTIVTAFSLTVLALSIWNIEALLMRNVTGHARAADDGWTFGQVAALILLVGPLFTFMRVLRASMLSKDGEDGGGQRNKLRRAGPDYPQSNVQMFEDPFRLAIITVRIHSADHSS